MNRRIVQFEAVQIKKDFYFYDLSPMKLSQSHPPIHLSCCAISFISAAAWPGTRRTMSSLVDDEN